MLLNANSMGYIKIDNFYSRVNNNGKCLFRRVMRYTKCGQEGDIFPIVILGSLATVQLCTYTYLRCTIEIKLSQHLLLNVFCF